MTTDTSEKGLETLIIDAMTGSGWLAGDPEDYDREYCVDLTQLSAFLNHRRRERCGPPGGLGHGLVHWCCEWRCPLTGPQRSTVTISASYRV